MQYVAETYIVRSLTGDLMPTAVIRQSIVGRRIELLSLCVSLWMMAAVGMISLTHHREYVMRRFFLSVF